MVQNVLGHYTRWDVLTLNFNRKRLSPFKNVSPREDGSPALSDGLKETSEVLREVREKVDGLTEKFGELTRNKSAS